MTTLFEKRERAAEGLFAHNEEVRFLIHRTAVAALGTWAGQSMELDTVGQAAYAQQLVDRLVAGAADEELLTIVQTDLERAGKPSLSGQVNMVFTHALADARQTLGAHPVTADTPAEPKTHEEWARRHPKSGPSWSL